MKRKFYRTLMHQRAILTGVVAAVTLFFGWFAAQVKFDNTIENYFLEQDIEEYQRFLDEFGTDEIIAIAFEDSEIFTPENIRQIDTLSRKLQRLPHVRRVLSLTTAKMVYGDADNVYFDPLLGDKPAAAENIAAGRRRAPQDPFIPGTILSADMKSTAIIAEIEHLVGEFDYKVELLQKIRTLLAEQARLTGKQFRIAGTAVLDDAMFRYNQRDQARFMPLMVLIMLGIIFVMFRRAEMMVLPVIVVLLTLVWTYGFLVILGYKINIISTIIPPLLMAVSIADSMHFIADYLQETAAADLPKRECIRRSFENLFTPCLMTSLTTAIGLLSLLSADLVPVREFGLVAAVGVLFAFIITIITLPLLLSILPVPPAKHQRRLQEGVLARLLHWLGRWHKWRAATIIAFVLLLGLPAAFALRYLAIGTNTLDYFRPDDTVRAQTEWIDSRIGGTVSLEFLIETGEEDALKNPMLLRKMATFQQYLASLPGITGVYSLADLVKTLNRAFHSGGRDAAAIPATAAEVAQELLLVEGSADLAELVSDDFARGRISARVEMQASQALSHRMEEIQGRMREIFGRTAAVTPTGLAHLMAQMERYLLSSQIKSFLLAFTLIALAMVLMLRSLTLGLLALIPNFLPILFTLAAMPLFGIALDVGTVMIAGVALGLVVDDTIHFLSRWKVEVRQHEQVPHAIAATMQKTGRPIIFTSIVLSLGFLILIFASFNPVRHFGILACLVVALALLFDLLVLPAMLGFFTTRAVEKS